MKRTKKDEKTTQTTKLTIWTMLNRNLRVNCGLNFPILESFWWRWKERVGREKWWRACKVISKLRQNNTYYEVYSLSIFIFVPILILNLPFSPLRYLHNNNNFSRRISFRIQSKRFFFFVLFVLPLFHWINCLLLVNLLLYYHFVIRESSSVFFCFVSDIFVWSRERTWQVRMI